MDGERVRTRFKIDERPSSNDDVEYLLPCIVRDVGRDWPAFAGRTRGHVDMPAEALEARVNELGPWSVPFRLGHGVKTMSDETRELVAAGRVLYRRDLINGAVATLLGDALADATVLDVGCSCGFFSLDMAERGVRHVDGVDLRPQNIAQAQFLAEHYGIDNVSFSVGDGERDFRPDQQWDVVLNLGVLYHVTSPIEFIQRTYDMCREFAIIDTMCNPNKLSAYIVVRGKDVERLTEGREEVELCPTYRGAIDTLLHVGFREVFEVVGTAERVHPKYANGSRRCFLAVK